MIPAINAMDRILRELRSARHRRNRELLLARRGATGVANELKGTLATLLLSCEMAWRVPNLQGAAEAKVRALFDLAQQLRAKLDPTT